MAIGKWTLFDKATERIGKGEIDFSSDTFKVMLLNNTREPVTATDDVDTDLTNELATANGYTAGGLTLTSVTWDTVANATFDAADFSWSVVTANLVARYAAIYDDTHASDVLICWAELGSSDVTRSPGQNFVINLSTSGIFSL